MTIIGFLDFSGPKIMDEIMSKVHLIGIGYWARLQESGILGSRHSQNPKPDYPNCTYQNPTFLTNRNPKPEFFQIFEGNPEIFRSNNEEELDVSNQNFTLKNDN